MPSTRNNSSGTPAVSSPGFPPQENAGRNAYLPALVAESEAAVDRLLANTDWAAHDAALSELAAQSDAAMHHYALLHQQEAEHAAGVVPAVHQGSGGTTT